MTAFQLIGVMVGVLALSVLIAALAYGLFCLWTEDLGGEDQ